MLLRRSRDRYFTPAEATAALPALRAAAAEARVRSVRRQGLLDRLRQDRSLRPDDRQRSARAAEALRQEVHTRMDEIAEQGAEVLSLRPLRIGFPALRDGVEVQLVWEEGEPTVTRWRARAPGNPPRHPVADPASPRWSWAH